MLFLASACAAAVCSFAEVRAGAAAVDVTPEKFPTIVNGMFLSRLAEKAYDPVYARALVLDDGRTRLAIVVVDSCMIPRDLLDRAKELARSRAGIAAERMLISATHTHSAPAAMGCLGTDADEPYVRFLPPRIAEAIERAAARLEPARIGWASVDDFDHTHTRRWILRPDKMREDPFGQRTVRANMHPGYQNPDAIGPSGPVDPQLSMLSVQSAAGGRPIALLANYSMHYFGSPFVSADYFGLFAAKMAASIGGDSAFVAMMSQGTSGDQMWMDYGKPKSGLTLEAYSQAVTDSAYAAYRKIEHRTAVDLAMAEARLSLRRRVPDAARLAWARRIAAGFQNGQPRTQPEVYAREQILLDAEPVRELKLQAVRIGEAGITAIPNEVFAITGLKLKAMSPLALTFNISLANGSEGYIPPPEQHKLGGYTTWPARTAALEAEAEPRIVETLVGLLEQVSRRARRAVPGDPESSYSAAVRADRPKVYWRLSEMSGGDSGSRFEDGIAFFLPGRVGRAVHLAGGRIAGQVQGLGPNYTAEFWFWSGLPNDARPIAGYLFSRGEDQLALTAGKLSMSKLPAAAGVGRTAIEPKTWNHVALVRAGRRAAVYLNGSLELKGDAGPPSTGAAFHVGGRGSDRELTFEGKVDEVAIYSRALDLRDILRHYRGAPPAPVTSSTSGL